MKIEIDEVTRAALLKVLGEHGARELAKMHTGRAEQLDAPAPCKAFTCDDCRALWADAVKRAQTTAA